MNNHKFNNKKGFTLVELLGMIVIIAIILLISIPIIGNVIGAVRQRVCDLNAKSVERAAENYITVKGGQIKDGVTINVPLKVLREEHFVTKVVDPTDNTTACDGYVLIEKEGKTIKSKAHIICPTYCNASEYTKEDTTKKNGADYYTGENPNNWVLFGRYDQESVYGVLWRIIKTDDGGIKLVFEGLENGGSTPIEDGRTLHSSTTGIQYDEFGKNPFQTSTLNNKLNNWLDNLVVIDKYNYVKETNWKIGGVPFYNPTNIETFSESEGIDSETNYGFFRGLSELSGIGLINPSDFMYTSSNTSCVNSYKTGGSTNPCAYTAGEINNFLYKNKYHQWTMNASSDTSNKAWYVNNIGQVTPGLVQSSVISVRPVINLDKNVQYLAGTGTIDDPYILEEYMIDIKNKPLITLIGQETIVIREGDSYTELGATAYDPEDGDITDKINITSNLNINMPGTYQIRYNVADSNGNKAPMVIRTIMVSPKDSPVITLNGDNPLKITLQQEYVEPGAVALDPYYGDISSDIKIIGNVNVNEIGVYELIYTVTNKDGKTAIPVSRKIVVEPPRPEIILNGDNPTIVYIGNKYTELGATATDEVDGDLTYKIEKLITQFKTIKISYKDYKVEKKEINESEIIEEKQYSYTIKYSVTNSFGATASVQRSIKILPDDGPFIQITPDGDTKPANNHDPLVEVTKNKYDVDENSLRYMWIGEGWRMPLYTSLEDLIRTPFSNNTPIKSPKTSGYYRVYVLARDIHGNVRIKLSKPYKIDNGKPVIYLNGSNPMKQLITKEYKEPGAWAIDYFPRYGGREEISLTDRIEISGFVDVYTEGDYYINYKVADDAGNTTERTRRVDVYISTPKIWLNGSQYTKVVLGRAHNELGARATDELDGDITSKIRMIKNNVDTNNVGVYEVVYEVENSYGRTATVTRNVEVHIPPPEITIIGDNPMQHRVLLPYQELGATVFDEIDGDLTDKLIIESNINVSILGKYQVKYSATNSNGKTTTVTRTVNVFSPPPVITLVGDEFVKLYKNSVYEELGATALDEIDGDLTSDIKISGNVNPTKKGTNKIKYEVTNSFGVTGYKYRTIEVTEPTVTIELLGNNPYEMYVKEKYSEPGFIATHELLGDVKNRIHINSTVNPNIAGKYTIEYIYDDPDLEKAVIEKRIVEVVAPKVTLTLNGDDPLEMYVNETYNELGAVAIDEIDGDISHLIEITSDVIPGIVGNYTVEYKLISNYGAEEAITRRVNVVAPEVILTLNGNELIEIFVGDKYQELGAKAIDDVDGDISHLIKVTGNLNTNIVGEYQLEYVVISNYGVEKSVIRQVNVLEQSGPYIIFDPEVDSMYRQTRTIKVTVTKNIRDVDNNSLKYLWSETLDRPTETAFADVFVNGANINSPADINGDYYLWILAKDIYGGTTIQASNRYRFDNTKPIITLNGYNIIELPVDSIYQELGAEVLEEPSGLNNEGLVITSNLVPGILGTYTVTYDATDNSGLKADTVTRTINVVEASLRDAPGADFIPKYYAEYFIGENPNNWVEFGNISDSDSSYVPILWRIIKSDDEGIKIVYEGAKTEEDNIPVENGIIANGMFDEISSNYNEASIRMFLDNWFINLAETEKDKLVSKINWCIGSINSPYTVDDFKNNECSLKTTTQSAVGLVTSGDYLLTSKSPCGAYNQLSCGLENFLKKNYDYITMNSDKTTAGYIFNVETNGALRRGSINKIQGIRPVVNLKPDVLILGGNGTLKNPYKLNSRQSIIDNTPPVVKFNPSTATGYIADRSIEVIVTDNVTGVNPDSLKYVWTTSTIKPNVELFVNSFSNGQKIELPKEQTINYYLWVQAKDRKGNETITNGGPYFADNTAPVITVNGSTEVMHKLGQRYIDLGATAIDNIDGPVNVTVETNLNINLRGTYDVIYKAVDKFGNQGIAIRKVVVNLLEIKTPEDLYNVRNNIYSDYIVVNDIDMANSPYRENFTVIPDFYGTIDGNNKKIKGLKITGNGLFTNLHPGVELYDIEFVDFINNSPAISNVGSITGTITNNDIKISGISLTGGSLINGNNYVGGIIGNSTKYINLEEISVNGSITGKAYTGGIIGQSPTVTIKDSGVNAIISGTSQTGGIIGYAPTTATIENSYADVILTGTSSLGGLMGQGGNVTIRRSYANGSIASTGNYQYIGGVIGRSNSVDISDSYSNANVRGYDNVGGLIGYNDGGTIQRNYVSGNVESTTNTNTVDDGTGGLVGRNRATIIDTYTAGEVKRNGTGGYIGGLVGYNYSGNISKSYVMGKLTNAQSFIGYRSSGTIINNYWIGETTSVYFGGYATLISSIQEGTNSDNYVGFDFISVWGIEYGKTTPYLQGLMISDKNYLENIDKYEGDGDGTVNNPYLIKTAEDLNNVRLSTGSYYKLMNDINMSTSAYANNFPTIELFNGVFDGNNKKIINLKTTSGLFNSTVEMEVKNLTLENVVVNSTTQSTGALVGTGSKITLSGVNITGTSNITSSTSYVGGIIGYATNVAIDNSSSVATVKGTNQVGGMIGYMNGIATIKNSYANINVIGTSYLGGLIGRGITSIIERSYVKGLVTITGTNYYVGGMIGRSDLVDISDSYSNADVKGYDNIGGLIGYNDGGTIQRSYVSGNVESTTNTNTVDDGTGGLVGRNRATIIDTYTAGEVKRNGTSGYIGGLVGYNYSGNISKSYVMGKLTNAQAFIGYRSSGTMTNNYWIGETTDLYSGSNATLI
ncbi:MAG: immunoglobulin-like domain-containing protein, partial [Bacilli bacterium]